MPSTVMLIPTSILRALDHECLLDIYIYIVVIHFVNSWYAVCNVRERSARVGGIQSIS
jgi:hypothetical protein